MKFINDILKQYLEKRGYFIESPHVDQSHHILSRISNNEFEDHLQLRQTIPSSIIDEATSIDEDIAQQLCDANNLNADLTKRFYWIEKHIVEIQRVQSTGEYIIVYMTDDIHSVSGNSFNDALRKAIA